MFHTLKRNISKTKMKVCSRGIEWGAKLCGMSVSGHFGSYPSLHFVCVHLLSHYRLMLFGCTRVGPTKGGGATLGGAPGSLTF